MGKVILRIVIFVAILFAAAYFLCDIKPATEYGWLAAIWHGLFLIPTVYKIFFVVGVVLDSLIGEFAKIVSEVLNNPQQ